ncbi:retrovirus-related pol polyprotein from transposon TNT 1-94 [Tanacetum coccineum]|uniref:Retrovirus-related pol polyprotein from transposon TNT 1-94 n=1 Tax=Tanacetum coccineum TaxID=301880 RepID=A0ABQ5FC18_9ASTR
MFCDNSAALLIANEPGVQKGARHYHRRYHYVRECIELGEINLLKVHTDDNLVDPFTKALPKGKLTQHVISEERGLTLNDVSLNKLGTSKKVTVSLDDSIILHSGGDKNQIEKGCEELRSTIKNSTTMTALRVFKWFTRIVFGSGEMRDQVSILAKDKGFGHEMHKIEESKAVYGVTPSKDYAITYSNKEMSHHTLYGVKPLLLYAATFKFTRDDLSESALRRNIGDKVTP